MEIVEPLNFRSCCHSNSREAGKRWFQGTADAMRQFHWLFENHRESGADITLSCLPMDDRLSKEEAVKKPYIVSMEVLPVSAREFYMKSNMRILITGGARFIGSHLVDRLMKNEKNEDDVVSRNWLSTLFLSEGIYLNNR
ncbi:hypothetical protein Ahy_A04g019432 isoform C [Arachis hypogaea]|uniref:Uncharacterized protein n=1 Tax=Arachis hypogaea TaxID=3818 RepID=A0A445DFW9_ARAHY|nr:hypothetical protein Ahy_A04g019432 isoform C [Arachis hypogaea]